MYDEVMQLIALAKNDEAYFKRIDELKQKMLELAQYQEIAKTLGEADMHLASARQKADVVLADAAKEAEGIKEEARKYVAESKAILEKSKAKKAQVDQSADDYSTKLEGLKVKELELEKSIKEHRQLTADRTTEMEAAQKVKKEFEDKLRKLREVAAA